MRVIVTKVVNSFGVVMIEAYYEQDAVSDDRGYPMVTRVLLDGVELYHMTNPPFYMVEKGGVTHSKLLALIAHTNNVKGENRE